MRQERSFLVYLFWWVLIIAFIFALLYFIAFKFYFTQDRLSKQLNNFISATTHRASTIDQISISPIGNFKLNNLKISQRGSILFQKQAQISSLQADVKVYKLLFGKIDVKNLTIKNFSLDLTYKGLLRFDYLGLFDNINRFFLQKYTDKNFSEIVVIKDIDIDDGNISLIKNNKKIFFKNISLKSPKLDATNFFKASLSFSLNTANISPPLNLSMSVNFDKTQKLISITQIKLNTIALPIEAKVYLNNKGIISSEFIVNTSKDELNSLLQKTTPQTSQNTLTQLINDTAEISVVYLK
jgi:hypothetical protein